MDTIPAAAISASGKNYVRFSDSTQFAFGTTTMSKSNVSENGNSNFTYFNQLYGAAFKNNDYYLTVKFIKNENSNAQELPSSALLIYLTKPSNSWLDQHSWRDASGFHINKPAYNQYFPSSFSFYAVGKWK